MSKPPMTIVSKFLEPLMPEAPNKACQELRQALKPGGHMVYGVPAERPLMAATFRLLRCNIRERHFSTEKEIATAAGSILSPIKTMVLRRLGGLAGPVYEARSFINDGHDNEARSFINDGHDNQDSPTPPLCLTGTCLRRSCTGLPGFYKLSTHV